MFDKVWNVEQIPKTASILLYFRWTYYHFHILYIFWHTLNEHLIQWFSLTHIANQIVMCYQWPDIFVCYLYVYIIIKHWSHVWSAQCCPDLAASSRSSSSPVVTGDLQWSHHCHHHHHHDHHGDTQYTRAHHHPGLSGGHESGQWENENSLTLTLLLRGGGGWFS